MPGGVRDSSLTRVVPVFDQLSKLPAQWPRDLLRLPRYGASEPPELETLDLTFVSGAWGRCERGLDPPVSLLSWLIRHPERWASVPDLEERQRLGTGDPVAVAEALKALRDGHTSRGWHILEGPTFPDAFIETPDALLVVEGKRTESGPTTHTKWMSGRHQIWRHIDAAWEIRGRRRVFGFFIVQGEDAAVPDVWAAATREAMSDVALGESFPHRSADEMAGLKRRFLGVTTWCAVCRAFGIAEKALPETIDVRRT